MPNRWIWDVELVVRVNEKIIGDIRKAVQSNLDKYANVSHFVRVCIMKELRRVNKKAKEM